MGPGDVIAPRALTTVEGGSINVPDREQLVHLQLRRFVGCPICSLHLQSMVSRSDEITGAGIHPILVFHSTAEEFQRHATRGLPFDVVADPDRRLYGEFGVEPSARALLDPRVWLPTMRALSRTVWATLRKKQEVPPTRPHGGRLGLPADLLIAPDGRVIASKYGSHAYDQWSVDELLALVRPGAATTRVSRSKSAASRDRSPTT